MRPPASRLYVSNANVTGPGLVERRTGEEAVSFLMSVAIRTRSTPAGWAPFRRGSRAELDLPTHTKGILSGGYG